MLKRKFDGKPLGMLFTLLVAVCLSAFALTRSGEWTLNPSDFRYDMSLYFSVEPAQFADLTTHEIGAFVGDECRGTAQKLDLPDGSSCMYMRIRSNSSAGDEIKFMVRDRATGDTSILKPMDGMQISFKSDEMVGLPSQPVAMTPYYTVEVKAGEHGAVAFESGEYAWGNEITLKAEPETGYHFAGWSDDNIDNPREMTVTGDIDLTASFDVDIYEAVFMVGDEVYETREFEYGAAVEAPEAPEIKGQTFVNWEELPATMPAQDIVVKAVYSMNTYKLTFIVDDAEYEVRPMAYGDKIEMPEMGEKEGYTFLGWSEAPATMPDHDVEVKGAYKVNTYKLTLILDGEVYREYQTDYGTPLNREDFEGADPEEREGYTFAGWGEVPETMPAHDVELTGSYTVNYYRIVFVLDGMDYEFRTFAYGDKVELPTAPEKEGYTFAGWGDAPETMPAADLALTGTYTANIYKLTLILDGEEYAVSEVAYGEKVEVAEPEAREGYTFSGWGTVPETMPAQDVELTGTFNVNYYKLTLMLNGEVYEILTVPFGQKLELPTPPEQEGLFWDGWDDTPETMPAHDLELHGDYEFNGYKLTLIVNGEVYEMKTVLYGDKIELPEMPEIEGYKFVGWGDVPATMPARDLELTGVYEANLYTLTLVIDGETYKVMNLAYGEAVTAEDPEAREGYTFSGWGTVPETMPASDVELTGTFTVNYYQLTMLIDGNVVESKSVAYGEKLDVFTPEEREGYTFSGWDEDYETMPAHDVLLVGDYDVNSYKLTLIVDGDVYKEEEVAYGTELKIDEPEAREGYTFSGWGEVLKTMPAHDVELAGTFDVNSYKLTLIVDGEVYAVNNVVYGEKLELPEPEAREGYTFAGWSEYPETMPAEDIEVRGEYSINSYKLTLYVDGELYKEEMVEYGAELDVLTPEAPEGMEFKGWEEVVPVTMPPYDVVLHGAFGVSTGVAFINPDSDELFTVYTINGLLICKDAAADEVNEKLQPGFYIINGKKVLVK